MLLYLVLYVQYVFSFIPIVVVMMFCFILFSFSGKGGEMIKMLQERAGCKMQMIQDGPYAATPEKPLRMTGFPENCKVNNTHTYACTHLPMATDVIECFSF